ncbi:MAG: threonine synthase [Firmicutes bacterium]|nr:threonine synthase [Bacillota bacterium]
MIGMFAVGYRCDDCGSTYEAAELVNTCRQCGGFLETVYDYKALGRRLDRRKIAARKPSIWKWREFLPLRSEESIVTLGEGGTPLVKSLAAGPRLGLRHLYFKNDTLMPTGSFKDRGFSLAISKARELGIRRGLTFTSGNAGASFAAYTRRAGMQAVILVKAWAASAKVAMLRAYGQEVIKLEYESFAEVARLLAEAEKGLGLYQFVNFINPVRHEAMKTYAYEICEDLGWAAPDRMIHPVGTGGGIYGAWKGFQELLKLGLIQRSPRMTAVQPSATSPFIHAFRAGAREASPTGHARGTLAESIAADAPLQGGRRVLRCVYESGGTVEAVSDEEILAAVRELGAEGIFSEPAGAAPLAALRQMVARGEVDPEETVVCVVTGTGLKQPEVSEQAYSQAMESIPATYDKLAATLARVWG